MVGDKEIRGVEEIHEMIVSRTSTLWMQGSPPLHGTYMTSQVGQAR
jgi:hypothetical protein